jgi:DNA-binding LytR/AlgR family response regulator
MKCIIIEDEKYAADHLEYLLNESEHNITVEVKIDSVKNAVAWLSNNSTDLIFLDIQLGDDISFSIFDNIQITTPIIFTTSYNEYALKAFEVNSLAYLLKPIDSEELEHALDKYDSLYTDPTRYDTLGRIHNRYQQRFLLQIGSQIQSVKQEEIAYFFVEDKHLFIRTIDGSTYLFDSTLEALESRLDPSVFFRINRQIIIAMHAIQKMYNHTRGRVQLETTPPFKEDMIVSIDRAAAFKKWLNN